MQRRTELTDAQQLDAQDELAPYRDAFVVKEPNLIYLDGNSLGRLTCHSAERVQRAVEQEWGRDLIRSWNADWAAAPSRAGDKIARLIGAGPGQVVVGDSTSVNLFKMAMVALAQRPDRNRIVSDEMNFPSDLYILQGCIRLLGDQHQLHLVPAVNGITTDPEMLYAAIDEHTALVTLSHVTFKSGFRYDMAAVTERAHQVGALVLWDLSHSVGAVPIHLDEWDVDLAVGCTYKYLNGGPGSPAFLYVRRDHLSVVDSPIWGWFGHGAPFKFELQYQPACGVERFLAGTAPMLSLLAMEAALEIPLEVGLARIRSKSEKLSEYLIMLFDELLRPLDFALGSPRETALRGSHVTIRHQDGYRINRALIEEMDVLPDFREPDNIRLGIAPLYTSFLDIWQAVDRLRDVVETKAYRNYPATRLPVT